MSVLLSDGIEQKRVQLDQLTDRTASWLTKQAIQDYLDQEAWQIAEIHIALCEADAGDFVSENEMNAKFKRWGN
ncbi:CopG family ribbon-helix-helix protein [Shewanella sp. 1180_01]|uniref:CopG family ribbon-helix-helix protein n=1 Tax=Shewanella sp. 1180_01 TaxID=2604451 RepID=UPI004063543E